MRMTLLDIGVGGLGDCCCCREVVGGGLETVSMGQSTTSASIASVSSAWLLVVPSLHSLGISLPVDEVVTVVESLYLERKSNWGGGKLLGALLLLLLLLFPCDVVVDDEEQICRVARTLPSKPFNRLTSLDVATAMTDPVVLVASVCMCESMDVCHQLFLLQLLLMSLSLGPLLFSSIISSCSLNELSM